MVGFLVAITIVELIITLSVLVGRDNFDFLNPKFIYDNSNMNIFGCFIVSILLNIICPIISVLYWSFKISALIIKFIGFIFIVGRR